MSEATVGAPEAAEAEGHAGETPPTTEQGEQKKRKGGRPKGSKDRYPRKLTKHVKALKEAGPEPKIKSRKELLFLKEIEAFGFKTGWQLLTFFRDLLSSLENEKAKNGGILPIDKHINDRVWQVSDLFKLVMSYTYVKLRPLEVNDHTGDRVVLNFNLGAQNQQGGKPASPVLAEACRVVQPPAQDILELIGTPEGFVLPNIKSSPEEKENG